MNGNLHGQQRVAQRDAGVREGRRVEDDEGDVARGRLLDAADQFGFGVALERRQLVPDLGGELAGTLVDLLQRHVAVDARLAPAEQVQVGAVQEQDVGHDQRAGGVVMGAQSTHNCRRMATASCVRSRLFDAFSRVLAAFGAG